MSESKIITEENVVVTADDCSNLRNYGEYFGVSISEGLDKALTQFVDQPTYSNQQNILREFCLWITTHPHESFSDPLWEKPKSKAQEFLPNLLLDHEMDKVINGDEDK